VPGELVADAHPLAALNDRAVLADFGADGIATHTTHLKTLPNAPISDTGSALRSRAVSAKASLGL